MRLFIAMELPADVRAHLVRIRDDLKSQISNSSFTRDENLHITLKFLGETKPERLDELIESLQHVRTGGAIDLFPDKLECFPSRGPIRIVAAGFGGDLNGVKALHRAIEQRCQHLGFERETREYRPHVTLARPRSKLPASIREQIQSSCQSNFPAPVMNVRSVTLVQSHLDSKGSEYRTLRTFEFIR